jgi:hypothetical protein
MVCTHAFDQPESPCESRATVRARGLLFAGVRGQQAALPLQQAWETAEALGARLLVAEVESLGRRARIELRPPVSRPPTSPTPRSTMLGAKRSTTHPAPSSAASG